jgi:hypothetical protein
MRKIYLTLVCLGLMLAGCAQEQQVDSSFRPTVNPSLYAKGKGPLLLIDSGHNNFHTLADKYAPFGWVAEQAGFVVSGFGKIDSASLSVATILVIANALHSDNVDNWRQPVLPAFRQDEIEMLQQWVNNGGSLFLIADHMPFAGAVSNLAQVFGFSLYDGFAYNRPQQKFDVFTVANGMLQSDMIANSIDSVVSFTGHAFAISDSASSIIRLDETYKVLMPQEAWRFSKDMKMIDAGGLSQLAYTRYGNGKVVMAGEAAMFTAQRVGDIKIGMNMDGARGNLPLLLRLLKWLSE